MPAMAPSQPTKAKDKPAVGHKDKIQELRALYAEGSKVGQVALEKLLGQLGQAGRTPVQEVTTAGRTGLRQGKVSELTVIAPFAPGGAKRLRALLKLLGANFGDAGEKVGTVHDMRFVFFDDDTRMLFTTIELPRAGPVFSKIVTTVAPLPVPDDPLTILPKIGAVTVHAHVGDVVVIFSVTV